MISMKFVFLSERRCQSISCFFFQKGDANQVRAFSQKGDANQVRVFSQKGDVNQVRVFDKILVSFRVRPNAPDRDIVMGFVNTTWK